MRATIIFDRKKIEEKVLSSKDLHREIENAVAQKVFRAKESFLNSFESHKVTQELAAGKSAANSSGSLAGYGNLFTFMGFKDGDENPIVFLKKFLEKSFIKPPKIQKRDGTLFKVSISLPTKEEIESITPLPFENGRSWVRGIEYGISGIGFYFYSKKEEIERSRSTLGIQSKHQIRGGSFSNQSYLTPMLKSLYKELKVK